MSEKQYKSLHNAIKKGHLHKVRDILQEDSDISNRLNQRFSRYGNTPIHEAAFRGHADILKLLLEHSVNVNAVGKKENTPLHDAAREGHVDIIQLLLDHGANVSSVNKDLDTPLHNAAHEGHVDILQLLLDHGANVNSVNKDLDTPLHNAACEGHVDIFQLLLDHGANVNSVNKDFDTPLHNAAREGHVDILQLLLDHGANVNSVDNAGNTPLHYAALNGHADILQVLFNHRASVSSVNKNLCTPLHYAAQNSHVDILQLLLKHGANINAGNMDGSTLLHLATAKGRVDILQHLLKYDPNVNMADKNGRTPLHLAAINVQVGTLQLLLNHGANVNVVDRWTDTLLHRAASFGRVKCIKLLLKSGANIEARNGKGETPYQIAVRRKDEESVQCFRNTDDEEDEELINSPQVDEEDKELMNSSQEFEEEEYSHAYLEALQEGEAKNNRIPIMLIGQDRGGKTSLMGRLLGLPFNKDQPSTIGIDVDVIELTEQNAENPWRKTEVKEFMTNEGEAETMIYKKTAEYVDRAAQKNSEGDAPEPVSMKPLLKEAISKVKLERSTRQNQKEVVRVFLNDFAGQSVYYDTHACFMKPHSPYVLVHDLSLEFDKPAVPRFKASDKEEEEEMNNPYRTTNADNFESCLKFLQGLGECEDQHYPDKSGPCIVGEDEEFELPPVLIALTHSDKVKADDSKIGYVRRRIGEILSAGKYKNVDPTFFLINNTLKDDNGDDVRKLRRKLFDLAKAVLKQEKSMPIRWVNFEAALSKKLTPNCKYITVDEAKKEAEGCGIQEFEHAIKFLHRLGAVVYHSGSNQVVLDPHWLMNRFTEVITMPGKLHASSRHALEVFKEKGILFEDYLKKLKDAELLEELMQKFNLISPGEYEGKPAFYVPSVAPSMTSGEELEPSTIPSLFVTFPRQLVPMSLFTKLQVKIISEWKKRFHNQQVTPSFYCNYSMIPLIMDGDVYSVRLIDLHEFIKVTVFPNQDGNHFKFARYFLAILKKCLDDLKSSDELLFNMTSYDLEVQCTCCFGKGKKKCSRHLKIQCDSDRCGHCHFWKVSELQKFYDNQSPAVCQPQPSLCEVFDIKSVGFWLSSDAQTTDDSQTRSMSDNCHTRLKKCSDSVGMIAMKNKDDHEPAYTGTGWLVGKDGRESYIMTNHHVISAINQRSSQTQRDIKVVIQFDYQTIAQPNCCEIDVARKAEISDENLDYAVLKVHSNCSGKDCLDVSTRSPNPNSNVNVIGHPKAEPKSFMSGKVLHTPKAKEGSLEELREWVEKKTKKYCPHEPCKGETKEVVCVHNYEKWDKLEKRKDFLLIHNCGTSKGASGSPVVNDNGEVIALATWGMFLGNKQQRKESALEFAHSINFIVKDIKQRNKALARKLKFCELKTE